MSKLYIIGNGFDLHHGLRSRYFNFKEFVEEKNSELFEMLQTYFEAEFFWSDFEAALAELNTDEIINECSDYLVSYSSDEFRSRDNHVYSQEVESRIKVITVVLRAVFTRWILSIETPENPDVLLDLDRGSQYLNFNYTGTLQKLYGIQGDQIKYIHNQAVNNDSELILGHGKSLNGIVSLNANLDADSYEYRTVQGNRLLDEYFVQMSKPTSQILRDIEGYFKSLNYIKEIYVLGHSLSLVDLPYFEKIIESVGPDTMWTVSYYNNEQLEHHQGVMRELGVADDCVKFIKLESIILDKKQLKLF